MKKLYLLRHAKSSWKHPELDDFERPLNARGRRDAPLMAKILSQLKIKPQLILSSPANRAATTARFISDAFDLAEDRLVFKNEIYEAGYTTLLSIIKNVNDKIENLILVGHNPGMTTLANSLADHNVSNIPTAAIYGMKYKANSWLSTKENCAEFVLFEYPKKYYSKE